MRKQRVEYDSPVDALVAIAKRLSIFETRYRIASEEFFDKFCKGQSEDSEDSVEWANGYRHYIVSRRKIKAYVQYKVTGAMEPSILKVIDEATRLTQ